MKKIFLLLMVTLTISCSNNHEPMNEPVNYDVINETEIKEYLAKNNLTAEKTESGLYYIIDNKGEGISPNSNSRITVDYKGYLLNKTVFEERENTSFRIVELIPGFSEAVQLLKPNGRITAIMPSKLAYKKIGSEKIPANSVVIFEIKLLSVEN